MGNNLNGRLGINDQKFSYSSVPYLVESLAPFPIAKVSCGWTHTAAVTGTLKPQGVEQGEVFTWGLGDFGALGQGDSMTKFVPTRVNSFSRTRIVNVSCGYRHTAFLSCLLFLISLGEGDVYTCGAGDEGQLGLGKRRTELIPQKVIGILERMIEVAAGVSHTCAVTESGALWTMGGNSFGQLGIGNKENSLVPIKVSALNHTNVKKVSCGHYTAAITSLGELYVWGTYESMYPQRISCRNNKIISVSIGENLGAALDVTGKLWLWGLNREASNSEIRPVLVESLLSRNVMEISCGGTCAIALGPTHYTNKGEIPIDFIPTRTKTEDASTMITGTVSSSVCAPMERGHFEENRGRFSMYRMSLIESAKPDIQPRSYRKEKNHNSSVTEFGMRRNVDKRVVSGGRLNFVNNESIDEVRERSVIKSTKEPPGLGMDSEGCLFYKQDLEELGDKILELEQKNESLKEKSRSEEEKGIQILKKQSTISKKYANAKAKLLAYVETEEKLLKENEKILNKLKKAEEELHELKKTHASLELLKSIPRNSSSLDKLQEYAQKLKESQEEILALKNTVRRLEEEKIEYKRNSIKQEEQAQSFLFTLKNELQSVNQRINSSEVELLQNRIAELMEENIKLKNSQMRLQEQNENLKKQQEESNKLVEERLMSTQSLLNGLTEENSKLKEVQRKYEEVEEENQKLKESQKKIDLFLEETHNIKRSQRSIDGLLDENQRLRDEREKLNVLTAKLQCKIDSLEAELKQMTNKLVKAKKVNEELEERNYRLMDALHQDVNNRAKQYRARALSILCQPIVKEHLSLLESRSCKKVKENTLQLSVYKNSKGRSLSPYRNLEESHEEFMQVQRVNGSIIEENNKRVFSPTKQEERMPPLDPNKRVKQTTGMAAKLMDFEQKLRKSLSRVNNRSVD